MLFGTRWHRCGTELKVAWEWSGRTYVLHLLDENGHRRKGHTCPGCGEYIYSSELLDQPPTEEEKMTCDKCKAEMRDMTEAEEREYWDVITEEDWRRVQDNSNTFVCPECGYVWVLD